jgi:glycosyltransferase involved in cell wall biosynthesis
MSRVLIFRELLLPISETFVLSQTGALSTFEPIFVGMKRATPSLPLPAHPLVLSTHPNRRISGLRARVYKRTKIAPRFHRAIEELRPDLIHAHFAPDGAAAVPLAERLGVPLVVTLHGYDATVRTDFRRRYSHLWRKADRFICVSDFIRKKAIEAGFPAEKCCVHYIGIDFKRFRPPVQKRTEGMVLFVGRLVEKKGCTYLLDAMFQVQRLHPSAHLVVIGDGPLRSSLEQRARQLGLNCRFLGGQPHSVVKTYLDCSPVVCVPSITAKNGDCEGLPIALLEAIATGVPVVASHHAGIPEAVIDGETGLLAREGDHLALADHILRFLTDASFRDQCTKRGQKWVTNQFDLEKQTRLLEEIYTATVSGRTRSASVTC